MAVKLPDGKIARTQPEQVKKNMDDIESINSELDIIKEGIASAYKIQGSEDVADLNALEKAEDMNGYVYNMLDAGNLVNEDASTLAVQIGDNVVFVWNGGDWYWDRLAGLVDTSNLCTLDTDQTITGNKTFDENITFGSVNNIQVGKTIDNRAYIGADGGVFIKGPYGVSIQCNNLKPVNNTQHIGASDAMWSDIYSKGIIYLQSSTDEKIRFKTDAATTQWIIKSGTNGNLTINKGGSYDRFTFRTSDFIPNVNNAISLGASGLAWQNIYVSGNLSDGTNSITLAQLHKIIKHQISANGKTVQVFSYYDGSYSGETIASIFGSVAGSTAWGMKATSELNNPDLIVVSDGGLAYFTGTGTFTKYLDPTDTITADSYSVWE